MSEPHIAPSAVLSLAFRQNKKNSPTNATPSVVVPPDHIFEIPAKMIKNISDMKIWEKSEAYFEYLGFIMAINEAVKGKSNSRGGANASEGVLKMVNFLDKLDAYIDETPPVEQPQRFGNVAFRSWFQKTRDNSLGLLQDILPEDLFEAIPEIVHYLVDSFGNATRIDYGTGHEISFIMFLCCLFKIGFLHDTDRAATGCTIFVRYLELARKLQKVYRMEPAGSHGVWSLDDYQFVPFIWGSSQLFAHPKIEPAGFLQTNVLNEFGDDYMFLQCINYINSVKTGPFAEHSNQLWSISGVSSWSKINAGLIKMYKAEVLSKFPVIQHVVFGTLFTLRPLEQCTGLMSAKMSSIRPVLPFAPSTTSRASSGDKQPSRTNLSDEEKLLRRTEPAAVRAASKVSVGEATRVTASILEEIVAHATASESDSSGVSVTGTEPQAASDAGILLHAARQSASGSAAQSAASRSVQISVSGSAARSAASRSVQISASRSGVQEAASGSVAHAPAASRSVVREAASGIVVKAPASDSAGQVISTMHVLGSETVVGVAAPKSVVMASESDVHMEGDE